MLLNAPFTNPAFMRSLGRPIGGFRKTFRRTRTFRKRYAKRFKRKFIRRGMRKVQKYEIKYSPQYADTGLQDLINSSTNGPISMINNCWPTAGTGKQQRIGEKIYIRKLVLYIEVKNSSVSYSEMPIRVVIVKTKKQTQLGGLHYDDMFTFGTTFPALVNNTDQYTQIPVRQGLGKKIYDKKIYCKVPNEYNTAAAAWGVPSQLITTKKKVFKINRSMEKSAVAQLEFDYMVAVIEPPTAMCGGSAPSAPACTLNWYFTYTDS